MAAVEAKARAAHEMLRLEEDRRQAADLRTAASEERAVAAEERARTLEVRVGNSSPISKLQQNVVKVIRFHSVVRPRDVALSSDRWREAPTGA